IDSDPAEILRVRTYASGNTESVRAAGNRRALGESLVRGELVPRGKFRKPAGRGHGAAAFFDGTTAAERHRLDSHRAHAGTHPDRHAGALAPHARRADVVAGGGGPSRTYHHVWGRTDAGGRR